MPARLASGLAQAVGGKGGGRPDMAEAGGKDPCGARDKGAGSDLPRKLREGGESWWSRIL